MGYIEGVLSRLKKLVLFVVFVAMFLWFPGGSIVMAAACRAKHLEIWDWVLSVLVPLYGLSEAALC